MFETNKEGKLVKKLYLKLHEEHLRYDEGKCKVQQC